MTFNRHCLIKKISISIKVINLYISCTLGSQLKNLNTEFTFSNCLFGSVQLTKNSDLDKYKYTGYGIGFHSRSELFIYRWRLWKNVIIFGGYMSSSLHVENKGKDILILGEGPIQGLHDTTLKAEAKLPNNFTQLGK